MFKKYSGKMRLKVEAANPYDEIFLIDGGYQRVAGGVGKLDVKGLDPGVYKLKFKAGNNIVEQSVLLNEPLVQRTGPHIELASPMPLAPAAVMPALMAPAKPAKTAVRKKATRAAAKKAPPAASHQRKSDSEILFYVGTSGKEIPSDFLSAVNLIDEHGRDIKGKAHIDGEALTANVNCHPGFHRLRVDFGELGKVEMPIWASKGFQTCVFLPLGEFGTKTVHIRPDLGRAAICMGV